MTQDRIVALCLVTQPELDRLGRNFDRAFPIDDTPCFEDLIAALDAPAANAGVSASPPDSLPFVAG